MSARVLVVEDEDDLRRGLVFNLRHEGYEVTEAAGLGDARAAVARGGVDLVVLDLALPDGDGLELLRERRAAGDPVPVLCLTARGQETDIVMGLGSGADDYVTKPFGLAVLIARVAALLRRSGGSADAGAAEEQKLHLDGIEVDLATRRVQRPDGSAEDLTPVETDLLRYLLRRCGRAVPREELLLALWGVTHRHETRTLDNHVARLRKKIEQEPARPRFLVTVHGTGYRWETTS
jgi:DNA-binding response OmpR family regulator